MCAGCFIFAGMTEQELREWFDGRPLPEGPIQISKSTTILDLSMCVAAEFMVLKNNNSTKMKEARILDLIEIKKWLESNGHA